MTSQRIFGGTFAEYRSTNSVCNYANGTDISGSARTPILAVPPVTVTVAYYDGGTGYNSYFRIRSQMQELHTQEVSIAHSMLGN
jgi:hypothetical protein